MNNLASLSKLLIVVAIAVMATGCNSMVSSIDGMKYGKLYTMQEVMDETVSNCQDSSARMRAVEWAVIGYNDLENSRSYMERSSEKYTKTRLMMRTLSQVSSRRNFDAEQLCSRIKLAAEESRHYLANIDAVEIIKEEVITLAAVKH